jgi:hypothetical protein
VQRNTPYVFLISSNPTPSLVARRGQIFQFWRRPLFKDITSSAYSKNPWVNAVNYDGGFGKWKLALCRVPYRLDDVLTSVN